MCQAELWDVTAFSVLWLGVSEAVLVPSVLCGWLYSLLRLYSAIESLGRLFWSTQITQFPVKWLSWGRECRPHSLMRNYVHASLMNPSVPLHFSVPLSLCSSLPLSPSPSLPPLSFSYPFYASHQTAMLTGQRSHLLVFRTAFLTLRHRPAD